MRNKVAAAVIVGLLAGLIPATPAVAHRSKCLPGKVSHKGCHKVWRGARNIGVPKKTIRKKIFRHPRRIATVPIQWKQARRNVEHFNHYGPTVGSQDRSSRVTVTTAAKILDRECLIGPIDDMCSWGRFGRAPVVTAAWLRYIKTWRWSKRCCWVKKRSVLTKDGELKEPVTVQDTTAIGTFQGWDYKGIVGQNWGWAARQFKVKKAKHYWHWSWIQPRWQVCFLRLAICYEDRTPRLHLWAGWGGDRRKWVDNST